jgi:hypothetical protein
MSADGSNPKQITKLSTGASGQLISPNGKFLVFTSDVYPECGADDACNAKQEAEESKSKVKARVYNTLLYRHWTAWQGKTRSHLLSMNSKPARSWIFRRLVSPVRAISRPSRSVVPMTMRSRPTATKSARHEPGRSAGDQHQ